MEFDLAFATKVFAALFAIMNPFANVPVFLSLTEGTSDGIQRRVAFTASLGTVIGCLVSALAGKLILTLFDTDVNDFRLAGGLLILLIAITMLQGSDSHVHARTPKEKVEDLDPASVAIYPLTVPLLVGPGTIATLIVFGETARTQDRITELAFGMGAFLVLLAATLLSAPFLGRHLPPEAVAITRRLMGMILAALGVEMIVTSLRIAFPGLSS
ncbi:MarC family protein [Methylobacterium radiodurans]|uniref:UPF0056 membrane protein n=1 Tax=Methylobacterium radiodurans TaxID=2202828 RepID=A0A2U8VV91_9HYPH|nr:MarC family protein [Methylobacterium radiodurans]AWN37723.1 antibiotic resistance protein MarC [Methylobacterium radiodurans]